MFSHPSEVFCRAGRVPTDAPETPLLQLAKQRDWRVVSYANDGTGEVEIAPAVFLEFANAKGDEEDEDDYTVSVRFHVKSLPVSSADLATFLPVALQQAADRIAEMHTD
jgi:hypothetical protein